MQVIANDVNNVLFEAGSYDANTNITLVESDDTLIKYYVRNVVFSNTGTNNVIITFMIRNNIIISKTLMPGEYMNYSPQIIVNNTTPLKFRVSENSIDVSVLFIEQIQILED